jgi:Na+/H+-translocating membrane pyrophosphatase
VHNNSYAYTTVAFIIGAFTSIVSGYIGMRVAVHTNVRTTKECASSIGEGFIVAFRGGEVLGFTLVGMALLVLCLIMIVF